MSRKRKSAAARTSASSKQWLREHFNDRFVQQAQKEGLRSRAAYKLSEIDARDRLIKQGMRIVDLGAAPGGWSQYAARILGNKPEQEHSNIVAVDLLEMEALPGVAFVKGDFRDQPIVDEMLRLLGGSGACVDLVLSDMAPNLSGNRAVDQPRSMYLAELSLDFAKDVLRPGGDFLIKIFQGEGVDVYRQEMRKCFKKLITRKPEASRARSTEVYLLGRGYTG